MQACFIVMATKSCNGCSEVSKALENVSSHLEGWHVLDVYKPYRARKSTVKTSSNYSNRLYYQLPNLLMTTGAELRGLMSQGRLSCTEIADLGKLTLKRLVMWTQLKVENLKGGVKAARFGLARGILNLGSGVARFVLWDQEVDVAIRQGSSRCLER